MQCGALGSERRREYPWIRKWKAISRMIKISSFKLPEGAGAEIQLGFHSCFVIKGAMLPSSGDGQNYNLLVFFLN